MAAQTQAPAAAGGGMTGGSGDRLDPALIRLAGIVLVGAVVVQLDATITSVAINTLARSFNVGISTIQWVSTGYLLALAMVIPVTGWSAERFGAKRMWLLSLVLFLVGSALCGAAWSAGSLIAFRIVQGLGGGLLLPLMQTIIAQAAGPERLGRGARAGHSRARAGHRRADRRRSRLALDLFHQRAGLPDRAGPGLAGDAGCADSRAASLRRSRVRVAVPGAGRDRLRLLRGRPAG
jgi:hypothetical protein